MNQSLVASYCHNLSAEGELPEITYPDAHVQIESVKLQDYCWCLAVAFFCGLIPASDKEICVNIMGGA